MLLLQPQQCIFKREKALLMPISVFCLIPHSYVAWPFALGPHSLITPEVKCSHLTSHPKTVTGLQEQNRLGINEGSQLNGLNHTFLIRAGEGEGCRTKMDVAL